jgi:hypothetical protein
MWNVKAYLPILCFSLFLPVSFSWAEEAPKAATPEPAVKAAAPAKTKQKFPDYIFTLPEADQAKMDVHPSRYAEFWKKWRFVGARWRQDTHEIRLTYANDLAWNVLAEGRTDYPPGAMFGKMVYPSEEDLALPSSVMSGNFLNRLMIMLWDPNHPKKGADGWTYVRFINPDPRAPQDSASTGIWGVMSEKEISACVECHNRAYDRGNVFTQPMYLFHDRPRVEVKDTKVMTNRFQESMKEMPHMAVPRIVVNLIESFPDWKKRKVKGYVGDFFSGSLNMMEPVMAKMAALDPEFIYLIHDRDDPNTLEIASSITRAGYNKCAGVVRLRGSRLGATMARREAQQRRQMKQEEDEAYDTAPASAPAASPAYGASKEEKAAGDEAYGGTRVQDLTQRFKPFARMNVFCDGNRVSRQDLPLLYTKEDKDGLPSYYFAPAKLD